MKSMTTGPVKNYLLNNIYRFRSQEPHQDTYKRYTKILKLQRSHMNTVVRNGSEMM